MRRGIQRRPIVCFPAVVRVLGKVLYWLAVLAISIALLIGLVLLFESRDDSGVEGSALPRAAGHV
jgi:hypothetical protein